MKEKNDPFSDLLLERHKESFFFAEDLSVLYIHGNLDKILKLPTSFVKPTLHKMLSPVSARFFKEAAREVSEKGEPILYKNIEFVKGNNCLFSDVSVHPTSVSESQKKVFLAVFHFRESPSADPNLTSVIFNSEENLLNRLQHAENDLIAARKRIRHLEFESTRKVKELSTGYQNLTISNEELQSTNEELQSVNEELHTVNEELHYKNRELQIANNDISNFLRSTDIGTIFLDKNLRIRKFTPTIKRQFDLISSDIGRSITGFSGNLQNVDLEELCRRVFTSEKPLQKLVTDSLGHDFLLRILPYRDEDGKIAGIVMTFVDMSKTKILLNKYDKSVRDMANKFDAIFRNSETPLLFVKKNGEITSLNRPLGNLDPQKVQGKNLFELIPDDRTLDLRQAFYSAFEERKYQSTILDLDDLADEGPTYFKFNLIPIPDMEDEDADGLVSLIAFDGTEEKKYLDKLEKTKSTFISFMANAQHQMVLLERNGTIAYINSANKSPLTVEELIGTKIYAQLPPGEVAAYKKSIEEIFEGKSNSKISFTYVTPEGEEAHSTVIATPVIVDEKVIYVALVGDPLD